MNQSVRLLLTSVLITSFVLFQPNSYAQSLGTIKGSIKDASTKEPLIGASVLVIGTNYGGSSDANGQFYFKAPIGKHRIQVSFVGYKTLQKEVSIKTGETITIEFEMQPDVIGTQ